jgi:hypothetical protein
MWRCLADLWRHGMAELLSELVREHEQIRELMDEIGGESIYGYSVDREKIHRLIDMFFGNMDKENAQLIPKLHEHAKQDRVMKHTIKALALEKKHLKSATEGFIAKFDSCHFKLEKAKTFVQFKKLIRHRLAKEERMLFEPFAKYEESSVRCLELAGKS